MSELVYGIHTVESIVNQSPNRILIVYIVSNPRDLRLKSLIYRIRKMNINIQECTRRVLNIKSMKSAHQGIIAEVIPMPALNEDYLLHFLKTKNNIIPLLLVLDGITDPHNLGACIRSADAAGVHMIIVPRDRSANVNATVRKVASGSSDRVPFVRVTNLSRTLKLLKKYNIYIVGSVLRSNQILFNTRLIDPIALVMGSESSGIRRLTRENCDKLVHIPTLQSTVSLNVSVATGIFLFETVRQRKYQNGFINYS
ncbi:probable tRNA/rRNA methyltransferase [Candidatus Blochmanniella floridana]|uniref:23S rRNA (guanosine-2'-O-)-methyltransferase RlmB n=1 Tax=Blochmanniella floridana TaxID=203907 RepID=RLMB_BLOFL|nr:RecName: Full=23S rRNA (guanosine-2'-O-)-methyltransferase RlmB; AltName: Full=23S rRNA (guanosine2251 2'-O)-methyltransferase; AltName: Full=23S rRNA Gm2251 2'-O-methyltransferase [Candidatus Blochmannia floridanus]CAD83607.1 probable tRNA/rRNA methyltransferase [Candidatus Blochmannia floridanus]